MRRVEYLLAAALVLPGSGCFWKRKAAPPPPAPPPPASDEIIPPSPKPRKPAVIPAPEQVGGTQKPTVPSAQDQPVLQSETPKVAPPPPEPAKKPPQRRSRATPPVSPSPTVPAPQAVPAEKPVQLGEMMPEEQRAQYLKEFDENINEAQRALSRMQGRILTSEQEEERVRVQNFLKQSRETRDEDLRNAVQLSKRAAVLAQELEKTLR